MSKSNTKLKVYTVKGFPIFDPVSGVHIHTTPIEVESSDWIQAQIDAGILQAEQVEKPKSKQVKPEA